MTRIELYDTTLRDGMQGEGMSLSAQEKLRVAHRLDELGIDLIEAGFPSSNPKELELFDLLDRERFGHAELAAFGMTRRRDVSADADPALRALAVGKLGQTVRVGIHCHDDAGCGVSCSLAAVRQGATQVQGTINGYGERCGNANLTTIIPNLQLKLGYDCVTDAQLASLTSGA